MPGDDDRFFGNAALASTFVAVMVNFIEDEFGAIVSPCEINEENLGSIRAVARFVASKQPFAVG
jgi:acyl carrier protein